jgi:hypothetical protein
MTLLKRSPSRKTMPEARKNQPTRELPPDVRVVAMVVNLA